MTDIHTYVLGKKAHRVVVTYGHVNADGAFHALTGLIRGRWGCEDDVEIIDIHVSEQFTGENDGEVAYNGQAVVMAEDA